MYVSLHPYLTDRWPPGGHLSGDAVYRSQALCTGEAEKTSAWLAVCSPSLQNHKEIVFGVAVVDVIFLKMFYRTCLFGELHSFNLGWAWGLCSKRDPLPWWREAGLVWPASVLFTTWLSCADLHASWEHFLCMHCLFAASFQFTPWYKTCKKLRKAQVLSEIGLHLFPLFLK